MQENRCRPSHDGRELKLRRAELRNGRPLSPEEYILCENRRSVNRIALIKHIRSTIAEKDWDAYVEIYGIPGVFVIMPPNIPEGKEREYADRAAEAAEAASGALPNGSDVRTLSEVRGSQPFSMRLEWLQKQLVLAGTGGMLTMLSEPAGLGNGASNAQSTVWETIVRRLARRIEEPMNRQYDRRALSARFPGRPALAFFSLRARQEKDLSGAVDSIARLAAAGYRVDPKQVSEETGYRVTLFEPSPVQAQPMLHARKCPQDGGFVGDDGCTHPNHIRRNLQNKVAKWAQNPSRMDPEEARKAIETGFEVTDSGGLVFTFGENLKRHLDEHSEQDRSGRYSRLQYAVAAVNSPIREANHRNFPGRIACCQVIDPKHIVVLLADRSGEAVTAFDIIPGRKIPADFLKQIDGEKGNGLSAHRGPSPGTDRGIFSSGRIETSIANRESEVNPKLTSQEEIENWFWEFVEKKGFLKAKSTPEAGGGNLLMELARTVLDGSIPFEEALKRAQDLLEQADIDTLSSPLERQLEQAMFQAAADAAITQDQVDTLKNLFQDQIRITTTRDPANPAQPILTAAWQTQTIIQSVTAAKSFIATYPPVTQTALSRIPPHLAAQIKDKPLRIERKWLKPHLKHFKLKKKYPDNIPLTPQELELIPLVYREADRYAPAAAKSLVCELDDRLGATYRLIVSTNRPDPTVKTFYKLRTEALHDHPD